MPISDSPSVKPEIQFVEELLEAIDQGRLRVPRFQRPFVWKPPDMLALLDSIYKGYPIGSLLLWESAKRLESLDIIGPRQVPNPRTGLLTYILDGHQRLATLYGSLCLPGDYPRGVRLQEWRWWIWFDLKKKQFTHVSKGEPDPWLLPLRAILRTTDFLEQARRIQGACKEDASVLIEEAENLAQKVKRYKLSITGIKGGSLDQAVEIFSRLNTKGKPMSPDQMVSALTYREGEGGMDLSQRIDEILEKLGVYHFGQIKRSTVFRAIMAAAEKDIYSTGSELESLGKGLGKDLGPAVDAAEQALERAARFFHEELRLPGDRLLPYSHQMLMLSEFFRHCPKPDEGQREVLKRWFWATSLSGWFAGANTTQIDNALDEMKELAMDGAHRLQVMPLYEPAQPFPNRFDMRSARIRAFLLFMLRRKPLDFNTGDPLQLEGILGDYGNMAWFHVFQNIERSLVANPANRVLLERVPGKSVKEQLRSLDPQIRREVLESHLIPDEAFEALERDDALGFIQKRAACLARVEREFIIDLGLTPAKEGVFGDADIDTDED